MRGRYCLHSENAFLQAHLRLNGRSHVYKRRLGNILLGCLGLAVGLILLEIIIRIGGTTGADGQFSFRGYPLEPYVINVEKLHRAVDTYVENEGNATIIYDETTGWTFRPNSIRHEGTFTINAGGLRSQVDYQHDPLYDTLAHCRVWAIPLWPAMTSTTIKPGLI